MAGSYWLYAGTYTRPAPHVAESKGEGIHIFRFDSDTGTLTPHSVQRDIEDPSYLAISHDGRFLYAVSEMDEGTLSAYAINREDGRLKHLNTQPAHGSTSAYVSVDQTGRYAMVANYGGAESLAIFPINQDGSLSPASGIYEHSETPAGTVPDRQERAHAHCIVPDPSNTYAFVCDLGLDKIFTYWLDIDSRRLVLHIPPYCETTPGAGPRHLVFHPVQQDYAYVIQELSSTVAVLTYDRAAGTLEIVQEISTLPEGFDGENTGSDIHVTPSGRYLYAGNRGHDSLAAYSIDQRTGKLSLVGYFSTRGKTPRNFMIDPTGRFVLAANQDSHSIAIYRIDEGTGALEDAGMVECPTPVCLKVVAVDR